MGRITIKQETQIPATPTTGNRSLYAKADGWYEVDDQGTEVALFRAVNIYGTDYHYANDQYESTNTTTAYKTYTGLQYSSGLAVAGRKYEIDFCATVRYSSASRNHITRVALDGVTLEEELQFEPKDSGTDIREPIAYKYIIDGSQLSNAGGYVDFDFKSQSTDDTSRVYSATLTLKRVL